MRARRPGCTQPGRDEGCVCSPLDFPLKCSRGRYAATSRNRTRGQHTVSLSVQPYQTRRSNHPVLIGAPGARQRGEQPRDRPTSRLGSPRTMPHSSTSASAREPPVYGHERPAAVSAVGSWPGGGRVDRPPHQGSDCDDEQHQGEQPDHCQCPKPNCSAPPAVGSRCGAVLRRAGGWAFRRAISGAGCISSSQHLTHVRPASWYWLPRRPH
jgi:hypothetical protein